MYLSRLVAPALLVAAFAVSGLQAQPIVIDDFSTNQSQISFGPVSGGGTLTSFVDGGGILQTERNLRLSTGALNGDTISMDVSSGNLNFSRTAGVTSGTVELWWDGNNDTSAFNPTGLGAINLTAGGQDRFVVTVTSSTDTVSQMGLQVWTDGSNRSEHLFTLPGGGGTVQLPYSGFTITAGTGAVFTNVGAIFLRTINASGAWTASIADVRTLPVELMSFSLE